MADKFLAWLADSPLATILKVGLAASLGYVLADPDVLGVPPIVAVGITAAIPVAINWLNGEDTRYGRGSE